MTAPSVREAEEANAFDPHGVASPPLPKGRIAENVVEKILDHVCRHPEDGPSRVSFELDILGMVVSAGGVYSLWRRMDLQTVEKRRAYAAEHGKERLAKRMNQKAARADEAVAA